MQKNRLGIGQQDTPAVSLGTDHHLTLTLPPQHTQQVGSHQRPLKAKGEQLQDYEGYVVGWEAMVAELKGSVVGWEAMVAE
jgi:hypothetical protein